MSLDAILGSIVSIITILSAIGGIYSYRAKILRFLRKICGENEEVVPHAPSSSSGVVGAPPSSSDFAGAPPFSSGVVGAPPSSSGVASASPSSGIVLIRSTELKIEHVEKIEIWTWTSHLGETVPRLVETAWLDIKARVNSRDLNNHTTYTAFLVFALSDRPLNLKKATALVNFGSERINSTHVYLDEEESNRARARGETGPVFKNRTDGWMEIKLGEVLYNRLGHGDIEIRFCETDVTKSKCGLIVRSIELRPNK